MNAKDILKIIGARFIAIAKDCDGYVYAYEKMPKPNKYYWDIPNNGSYGSCWKPKGFRLDTLFDKIEFDSKNWKKCLIGKHKK